MACRCPHDVKDTPPEPEPARFEVVSSGQVRYTTTDRAKADTIAARWPGGSVRTRGA